MASPDPLGMAQDVIRCTLCEDAQADLNCNTCNVGLCGGCVSRHITSKMSSSHDIVPFTTKKSKIPFPKCKSHSKVKCDFQCRQCNVPVCTECVTSLHKMHDLMSISDTIASIVTDIQQEITELDTVITEEYNKVKTETKTKLSKIQNEYQSLKKSISDHGKEWHREIDAIIAQFITDVERMEKEDLATLNKQLTELENILTEIKNASLNTKQILASNNSTQMFHHKSRNEEFYKVPARIDLSSPSFAPLRIEGLHLMKLFGTLTSTIKTEISEHMIEMKESISSLRSVKHLLDVRTEIISTRDFIYSMTTVDTGKIWIGRKSGNIDCIDINGTKLESIHTLSGSIPFGLTVTHEGHLIYTECKEKTVNLVRKGKTETVIRTGDWEPSRVCASSTGDLLVCLQKDKKRKLVRYSGYKVKNEMQFDDKFKPLFADGPTSLFIAENRDQNICVSDFKARAVVVLNQAGKLQFRYDGNLASKKYNDFVPRGIATDSQSQILIADRNNHCVHIINRDGKFLRYIENCQPQPLCLSVNSDDQLFVSGALSPCLKIIKYMK